MSEVESEVLSVPINDQVRLALIYIGKFLEKLVAELRYQNKVLEGILAILDEGSIHVHMYRGDYSE